MRTILACAVSAAIMAADPLPLAAKEFPTHVDIQETNAKWQWLPEAVKKVFVQDGKRVWYELDYNGPRDDLAGVERIIRGQFNKPSPQLFGASVQLFETGGRVWFRTHSGEMLLSYDGKDLSEYPAHGEGHYYVGTCTNTGVESSLRYKHGANCQVGRTVFIAESHGVLCVTDGKADYHAMTDAAPLDRGELNYPVVVLEADGQGVLAHLKVNGRMILHRWRDGLWKPIEVPGVFREAGVVEVAPWPDGVWVFQQWQAVCFVPYEKPAGKVLDDLVARLGHKEFAAREEATQRLMTVGVDIRKALEEMRKAATDPEIKVRLDRILAVTEPRRGEPRIGDLELKEPALGLSEGGWMYVQASKIYEDGLDRGRGVALFKPGGNYRLFLGEDFYRAFGYHIKPLVVKEHALIWTSDSDGQGPKLFDVEKGKFVAAVSKPATCWSHAVKSDGTVYTGNPVGVFRPSGEEPAKAPN